MSAVFTAPERPRAEIKAGPAGTFLWIYGTAPPYRHNVYVELSDEFKNDLRRIVAAWDDNGPDLHLVPFSTDDPPDQPL